VAVKSARSPAITIEEYARLAAFRLALRTFLHFSEEAAAQAGLTGQHYQALLVLRACPADQSFTINDLAQQLFLKHNSTVALVDRLEADGLLVRIPSSVDRRKVELRITAHGSRVLARLAQRHRAKLQRIGPDFEVFFRELSRQDLLDSQPDTAPKPARRRAAPAHRAQR
jgi:DNA-binding MarR family transcriptional regulator